MRRINNTPNAMKQFLILLALSTFCTQVLAQKETYDVVSYIAPKGWQKETGDNTIAYTLTNTKTKSWCRISIIRSTASEGDITKDFDKEWQDIIVKNYHPVDTPQSNDAEESEGWKIKAGLAKFNFENNSAIVLLTTATGYDRCASIVAITNDQDYLQHIQTFIGSVDLKKPEIQSTSKAVLPNNSNPGTSMIGIWGKTSTNNSNYEMNNGLWGYITCQYTFKKDGTYDFIKRAASYLPDILVTRETGTYQVKGNTITLSPQKGHMEKWSKGTVIDNQGKKATIDKLGKLLSSQPIKLEKITYRFSKEYFSGINEWQLQLVGDKETVRDGPFNGSSSYPNTWFYKAITSDVFLVKTD
jgi:hypothetical protein